VTPGTQGENFGSGSSESSSSAPAVTTDPKPTDPENLVTNPPIASPNEQGESQTQAFNSSLVIAGLLGLAALLAILLAALRRRKQAENNL
jgi:LPXTG-motif cell wall-anchored protein